MPATPSQIRRPRVVKHAVDFGEGVAVEFVYDRNKLTDAWMDEWAQSESEAKAPKLNEMLHDLILSWDILNDDGTPFPKTAENIGYLFSVPDKALIFGELLSAAKPSSAEGNVSPAHSSTPPSDFVAPQPTPQNGQATSSSPVSSTAPSPT